MQRAMSTLNSMYVKVSLALLGALTTAMLLALPASAQTGGNNISTLGSEVQSQVTTAIGIAFGIAASIIAAYAGYKLIKRFI